MVNNDSCCFAKILKVIEILQNNSTNSSCCNEGCDKPFLGPKQSCICYNTRPVQFYTKAGELFNAYFTEDGCVQSSNIFRVEKVNDCCVKCRILKRRECPEKKKDEIVATNNFITINLKCMCVVKCLNDIALDCI